MPKSSLKLCKWVDKLVNEAHCKQRKIPHNAILYVDAQVTKSLGHRHYDSRKLRVIGWK